jgi:hypothetical protein
MVAPTTMIFFVQTRECKIGFLGFYNTNAGKVPHQKANALQAERQQAATDTKAGWQGKNAV